MRTADLFLTFLLNAAWQIPLVATLGIAGSASLRRAPARFRHGLWLAALAASLLLPLASLHRTEVPPGRDPAAPGIEGVGSPAPTPLALLDLSWLRRDAGAAEPARAWPAWLVAALGGAYAALLLAFALRLGASYLAVRRLERSSFAPDTSSEGAAEIAEALIRCRSAFGLGEVTLRFSREIANPVTFGFLRPIILVPEGFFRSTSRDEQIAALGHEAAHIARCDYLIHLVVEVVLLPIAFHPAAWFLRRRLVETREMACDEATSERFLGPRAYARSLLSLAALGTGLSRHTQTLGVFDAGTLEVRMRSLIESRSRMGALRARIQLSLALLLVAATGLAMSGLALKATAREPNGRITGTAATPSSASPASAEWAPFLGRWIGDVPLEGVLEKDRTVTTPKREEWPHFADVEIRWVDGTPQASLTLFRVHNTKDGFTEEADPPQVASEVKVAGRTLAFRIHHKGFRKPDGRLTGTDVDWAFDLTGPDHGRLRFVRNSYYTPARARGEGVPPPPPVLEMRKEL